MPDLLLWRPADRRAKLSEVKGPRDRLSEQQRAWAAALSGAGLQVPQSPRFAVVDACPVMHVRVALSSALTSADANSGS